MASRFTSATWWKGALLGAAKQLAIGLVVGFIAAAAIYAFIPPELFTIPMAKVLGFVTEAGAFSPLPLMMFNGLLSSAAGLFSGGNQALNAEAQAATLARDESKLRELDGRAQVLEQEMHRAPHIQKIIAQGPRNSTHLETAESIREQAQLAQLAR